MAGDACTWEIIQPLAGHFYYRNNSDIGLASGQLVGTFRGQGKTEIEGFIKGRVMHQPPYQRDRIQVADGAYARPGKVNGVQLPILALALRMHGLVRMVHGTI